MEECDPVVSSIAEVTGHARQRLTDDASLYPDLGIAGDDGIEIIELLSEKCGVDWAGFEPVEWFGAEQGFELLSYIFAFLKSS